MGTFLRVPIIKTIVYLGLDWGPLILGNYHIVTKKKCLQIYQVLTLSISYWEVRKE